MSAITAQIVLRFVAAAEGTEAPEALLARVGVSPDVDPTTALRQMVDLDAYYDLLERAAGADDHGLPFRYAASLRPEDFGALGLALETARNVRGALERLARYVLVISDSLEYELRDGGAQGALLMRGRPHHRRGARLANEAAFAAVTSLVRQITGASVVPASVSLRHPRPASIAPHRSFFGCPLRFGAPENALAFDGGTLATETRLSDEGLSAFLLARLEEERERLAGRSLEARVHRAVIHSLCDGPPSRAQIARRLGMSERTLQRRLAQGGLSFRAVAARARREVAESLLSHPDHTLAEVAFLTGFSEQSAFQRAFKRWSGQTPLAFRRASIGALERR
jgi:AraC-like DNA-binding protein